ncbi:hypothetical protein ACTZWW_04045 [Salinarimonas sp. NSM]|uniref:hypothetical protein n=1 Tax=Salinarimonas sp. NSM TaxID=3458003 RepID=UPI0040353DC2
MDNHRIARRRAYADLDGRTLGALVEQVEAIREHTGAPVVPDFATVLEARAEIKAAHPKPEARKGKTRGGTR